MRADLLPGATKDLFDRVRREVVEIVIAPPAFVDVAIGRKLLVLIIGQDAGQLLSQLSDVLEEQKPERGPGGVDVVGLEQVENAANGIAFAAQVRSVVLEAAAVAHAPIQLQIQRDSEYTRHMSATPR